jgi:hypothetical protein
MQTRFKRGDGVKFLDGNLVCYGRFCYQSVQSALARIETATGQLTLPLSKLFSMQTPDEDIR